MWNKPWKFKEGTVLCIGLVLVGLLLQISLGPINWDLLAAPVNIIFLILYLALLALAFGVRNKVYAIRWAMTNHAAVPSILIAGLATVIYGITCERSTLSAWPFVLLYFWLTTILGLTCMKHWKNPTFLLNHLGLFLSIICATLGSADMQKLRMQVNQEEPEWRAWDENNRVHELDLSIQLNHFTIEEYPPKLVLVDNETGIMQPAGEPASLVLEDSVMTSNLLGHEIQVEKLYTCCALSMEADSINYIPWNYAGATTAARIRIDGGEPVWVSNGSYLFPFRSARVDNVVSIVMPECEPKRFLSSVNVFTKNGKVIKDAAEIEVNKPLEVDGWKIYQLSYDDSKGRWSNISILELVRDPWLPGVYAGIFMLLAGALFMFITAGGKKK